MKKASFILILLFIYILLYKFYLISLGEIMIYIINPLIWLVLALLTYLIIPHNKQRIMPYYQDAMYVVIAMSLIYDICYYTFGLIAGYTNNPYATTFDGLIINLFSLFLVIAFKEYIRYNLVHTQIRRYKKIYFIIMFLIFMIIDINIANLGSYSNILELISKELLLPIISNAFAFFLIIISDYKINIVHLAILTLPSLIFNVVPNYNYPILLIFVLFFYFVTYFTIQYVVDRNDKTVPARLAQTFNPRHLIVFTLLLLMLITFGLGLYPLKPFVVLSGSMQPLLKQGDMLIISECQIDDIKIGDIVAYRYENLVIIHRVIALYKESNQQKLIFKGDSNSLPDVYPVTSSQIVGKLKYNIPYIGYPTYLLKKLGNNDKGNDIKGGDIIE